jgi:hypothetical protein
MTIAQVNLTDDASEQLHAIAQRTGKTQAELVREAIDHLIAQYQHQERKALMQEAKGIWKDRDDLPLLTGLRDEFDRLKW